MNAVLKKSGADCGGARQGEAATTTTVDLTVSDALKVSITDALNEQDVVKYTVKTKTTLDKFQKKELEVIRQHEVGDPAITAPFRPAPSPDPVHTFTTAQRVSRNCPRASSPRMCACTHEIACSPCVDAQTTRPIAIPVAQGHIIIDQRPGRINGRHRYANDAHFSLPTMCADTCVCLGFPPPPAPHRNSCGSTRSTWLLANTMG